MSVSITRNISANAIGRIWQAGLQFVITPILIALLGPKSYGLVGFNVSLLMVLMFLDQCVSPVLARELARGGNAKDPDQAQYMRNLLRSLEAVSFSSALIVGTAVIVSAPSIVGFALNSDGLPRDTVVNAVRLMGLGIACQWPMYLYSGGFIGLQRQDILTNLRLILGTVQAVGAVVLLWGLGPGIELFLGWQAISFAVNSIAMRVLLWRILPAAPSPTRFDPSLLRGVWRFAAGSLSIGLTGALLTQSGSLLVAKYCTLDQLAAYSLCFALVLNVMTIVAQPVTSTLMPHFSRLMLDRNEDALAREYHRWSQIVVTLALPVSFTLMVFGKPLMQLWLGPSSPLIAPVVALLPWIAAGTMFNMLMTPPFLLQMAFGWTRLSVQKNVVALAIIVPALLIGVPRYGPVVAALCWVGVNLGYYLFEVPLVHRRLLRHEMWAWWGRDTLLPMIITAAIFAMSAMLAPVDQGRWMGFAQAALTAALAGALLIAVLPYPRAELRNLRRFFTRDAS